MKNYLIVKNVILKDARLTNKDVNTILCLIRNKDNLNKARLSLEKISELTNNKYAQNTSRILAKLKKLNYFEVEKDSRGQGGLRNVYVFKKITNDFTFIPIALYDRFNNQEDIIANYLKLKRVNFILRNKKEIDIEDYISLLEVSADEFLKITKKLQVVGLIKRNFSIDFLLEDIEKEIDGEEILEIKTNNKDVD